MDFDKILDRKAVELLVYSARKLVFRMRVHRDDVAKDVESKQISLII